MQFPKSCGEKPERGWKNSISKFGTISVAKEKKKTYINPISQKKKDRIKNQGSESELFLAIWGKRPHKCEDCGKKLYTPRPHNFDHVIPKSRGEQYRLDENNIKIVCFGCHYTKTTGQNYKGIDLDR